MENGVYTFRQTLPQIVVGTLLGALPGTLAGAAIPAIIGFALLGLTTPHRITAYFSVYLLAVMLGGLAGAVIGGSTGACRRLEQGCPAISARQIKVASVVGALLAIPLAYLLWLVAGWLAALLF